MLFNIYDVTVLMRTSVYVCYNPYMCALSKGSSCEHVYSYLLGFLDLGEESSTLIRMLGGSLYLQVYMCATILICVLCQKGPHAYMCILYLLDALVGYLDSLRNSQS